MEENHIIYNFCNHNDPNVSPEMQYYGIISGVERIKLRGA
jgi:hypothetical protein